MKKTVLAIMLAVLLTSMSSCTRTPNSKITYIVDGQMVDKIDSSQIKDGIIVSSYINSRTNRQIIITTNYTEKTGVKIFFPKEIVYVIDGNAVSAEEVRTLNKSEIGDIKVIKDRDDILFKTFADDSTKLVWYVTTK